MPITKSAKKAAKRSLVFQKRNNDFKIRMKANTKKFTKTLTKGGTASTEELSKIYKYIDKCAKVGVIKKKTAARKKSKVAKLLNKTSK